MPVLQILWIFSYSTICNLNQNIWLLPHWSYIFLALTHRFCFWKAHTQIKTPSNHCTVNHTGDLPLICGKSIGIPSWTNVWNFANQSWFSMINVKHEKLQTSSYNIVWAYPHFMTAVKLICQIYMFEICQKCQCRNLIKWLHNILHGHLV